MPEQTTTAESSRGTLAAPNTREALEISDSDARLRAKAFTFEKADGVVAGYEIDVTFTIDAPVAVVWPQFKDWNRWQNHSHVYSGAPGDLYSNESLGLGTETFRIAAKTAPGVHGKLGGSWEGGEYQTDDYIVLRVVPEHLIIIFQPVPERSGAVSPGFHTFLLSEQGTTTTVTGHMEHAILTDGESDEELFEYWSTVASATTSFWHQIFIPALKQAVADGSNA
jgi:uncharacterized protein YndB with AHSA1/START domain